MFTIKELLSGSSLHKSYFSFITEVTLRFVITRALSITFNAQIFLVFFYMTFQTLPNPPFPAIFIKLQLPLLSKCVIFVTLWFFLLFSFCLCGSHLNSRKIGRALIIFIFIMQSRCYLISFNFKHIILFISSINQSQFLLILIS